MTTEPTGANEGAAATHPADWKDRYYTKDGIRELYPLLLAGCQSYEEAAERIGCQSFKVRQIREMDSDWVADGIWKWSNDLGEFRLVLHSADAGRDRKKVAPETALACAALEAVHGVPLESLEPGMVSRLVQEVAALKAEVEQEYRRATHGNNSYCACHDGTKCAACVLRRIRRKINATPDEARSGAGEGKGEG